MSTNSSLIWNPRNFKHTKINDSTVLHNESRSSSPIELLKDKGTNPYPNPNPLILTLNPKPKTLTPNAN